ncbi:hypothetical protein AMATHDRAFT_139011 [Amanita thiersii Skay4041]|uniref:Nuclear segregation protein Bfr1 n=1 Tax=Amanita thiersii Skay4041 TaxID=703135 RepID=A0A2A9NY49_9AGAR|nr:hypothetical protein AMATHDRAFT_139011 [Amanita thiersii Skay4041]
MPPKSKSQSNNKPTPLRSAASTDTSGKDIPSHHISTPRPDKKAYETQQSVIKSEIDVLQSKLSAVREKITLATRSGPPSERETALRSERDGIRSQQSTNKSSRSRILDQVKTLQENVQKKVKDLQTAKSRIPFKSIAEIDTHIKNLEKQVESGSMKLADEKRALQDINTSKRHRRTIETFQPDQDAIDADRRTIEDLRKQLDDPEAKAISERYEAITAELDQLKKERDEIYANRSKLFEERDGIQAEINKLFVARRESQQQFREANDRYWTKVKEDTARREERRRAQQAAEEAQKRKEIAERLREEATVPAFQTEIEDCQTLIDHFSGKTPHPNLSRSIGSIKTEIAGVPKLDLRQVEGIPEGEIVRKKGEGEETYFVGAKAKGKKGTQKPISNAQVNGATSSTASSGSLNIPLAILTALGVLSIPAPTSSTDVPRVIEDLKTKKLWFEANQTRVTAENVAKAEAEIKRLLKEKDGVKSDEPSLPEASGIREAPAEPTPTPQTGNLSSDGVATAEAPENLVAVQGHESATIES